jgi:hypothetical protein
MFPSFYVLQIAMAYSGGYYAAEEWEDSDQYPPKRARRAHEVSDSEYDANDGETDDGYDDRFQNPEYFLKRFGGYQSDNSEDPDEDEEEETHPKKSRGNPHQRAEIEQRVDCSRKFDTNS